MGLHHPAVGDHWHAAYGIYVCDHFLTPIQNITDVDGIHTHGDGLIHVHPFSSKTAGANATLAAFATAAGMTLTDTTIADEEFGSVKAGDDVQRQTHASRSCGVGFRNGDDAHHSHKGFVRRRPRP